VFRSPQELHDCVGQALGTSEWLTVTQDRIDAFATVSGDDQWIHVDRERAAAGPFEGTIAQGYLTLALLPYLARQVYRVDGMSHRLNYGFDRVRFITPVRVGSRIRSTVRLTRMSEVEGGYQVHVTHTVGVEAGGREKPACVAEIVSRIYV
jgi:acyl dehydratase